MRKGEGGRGATSGKETPPPNPLNTRTIVAVMVILALGLVFFYAFSAPYGDGLEVTMEQGGAEEGEATHEAPLDYGDDHLSSFIMGLVGFIAVLLVIFLLGRALPDKGARGGDGAR